MYVEYFASGTFVCALVIGDSKSKDIHHDDARLAIRPKDGAIVLVFKFRG